MKVTIPRDRWDRGRVGRLKDVQSGKMCILGHILAACGVPEDDLLGRSSIFGLYRHAETIPSWIRLIDDFGLEPSLQETQAADDLILINDNQHLADSIREDRLKSVAAQHDVELEFV